MNQNTHELLLTQDERVTSFLNAFQNDLDQKRAILIHKSVLLKDWFQQFDNEISATKGLQMDIQPDKESATDGHVFKRDQTQKIWINFEEISTIMENNLQFFPFPTLNNLFKFSDEQQSPQELEITKDTHEDEGKTQNKTPVAVNARSKKIKSRKKIPKEALEVLKGWITQNIHDPYPSNDIKNELAKKAGLDFKQVHNWFINARGRTCKSMLKSEKFGNLVEKTFIGTKLKALPHFLSKLD